MEVPLLNSEIVGDLANTAQLTGLDAVKIIALIIRVASNPQILRRRCRQFARHVKDIGDLLEELNIKETMEYQETRNPLNRLEEVLKKSYVLVKQCQERCYLKLLLKGWSISHELEQAQADIDEYLKIIPLMVLKEIRRLREHCVNDREDEESKRKLAAHTAALNIFMFKQLLDEASEDITDKTNYEYFAKKWGHDERFKALDPSKRESLLNERVLSLRKDLQEKGKTRQATPIASFKAMLSDSGDINSSSEWSKGNPSNLPFLVGELIDDDVPEDFIENLIMSVGDSLPIEQLIEECEKRNRLRLLKKISEHLVSEGSQDVHVHSALGKISIDTHDNPEHFLTTNPYYDSHVVGKHCEKRNPTLAVVSYWRGQCDDELIDVTNKNFLFEQQARYVVERADPQLWKRVLALENPHRRELIDWVASTVLPENKNSDQVSETVTVFINADRPHELIELLEKIVLQNSTFSGNPYLQDLLIRKAIEADRSRLMDYINRLDNFDGPAIGEIAIGKKLYEEAFNIFKKFNLNVQAVNVLLDHIRSFERAYQFASHVKEDVVWSQVAKAQLREGLLSNAIESFIRADDATQFRDVIRVAEETSLYHDLVQYLLMVMKNVNEPKVHTELNAKLASAFVKLRQFQKAFDAARNVNRLKTWKEVCFACVDAEEFRLAQLCGFNIIVQVNELKEVSDYYRNRGRSNELISLMEEGLRLERWHMGLLTELRKLYSEYRPEKLKEHTEMF